MGNTPGNQEVHDIALILFEISKDVEKDSDGTRITELVETVLSNSCNAESWPDQKISSPQELATTKEKVLSFLKVQDKWTALGSVLLKSQAFHVVHDSPESDRVVAILPRTENRKPYIPTVKEGSKGTLHPLSISHQFPFIGGALLKNQGKRPKYSVGLDVVVFDEYNKKLYSSEDEFLDVFRDSFTEKEWNAINAEDEDRIKEFYVRWATKEAYTKALGVGLGFEFNSFDIQFKSFEHGGPINTGLWSNVSSSRTGLYLSGTLSGEMEGNENSLEVWEFFFLPLEVDNNESSGCACVCLGPFGSLATKPRMIVNNSWTSLGSLIRWHGYEES